MRPIQDETPFLLAGFGFPSRFQEKSALFVQLAAMSSATDDPLWFWWKPRLWPLE